MSEPRVANPLVEQFRRGGVPRELRLLAAQGALPLKPADLVELLHFLIGDRDESVAQVAAEQLKARPAEELLAVARERSTPGEVLAWLLGGREEKELLEAVLQNTSTPDEAIEAHAPGLPEGLAELVVINQVRLLRRTSLLEAIESNPALNNDQKRRLRELRETFRIGAPPPEAPAAPAGPVPAAAATAGTPAAAPAPAAPAAAPEPVPEEALIETAGLDEGEAVVRYLSEEERQQSDKVSAVQRLYRLNTAEKVITALKGTREERAVLIRDPNRIVATAVLGSPRVTEAEIESFAGMKNVSDEILRQIGANRDWTKKYTVVSSLVKNPRTPLSISLGMVSRLNPRDLKSLSTDRNVSEVIRKQAQKFVKAAQAGPGERDKH